MGTTFKMRVGDGELACWREAAKGSGMTLTEWVKGRCRGVGVPPAFAPVSCEGMPAIPDPFFEKRPEPKAEVKPNALGAPVPQGVLPSEPEIPYDDRVLEPDESLTRNPNYRPVPGKKIGFRGPAKPVDVAARLKALGVKKGV